MYYFLLTLSINITQIRQTHCFLIIRFLKQFASYTITLNKNNTPRPQSEYVKFIQYRMKEIKQAHPKQNAKDIMKTAASEWNCVYHNKNFSVTIVKIIIFSYIFPDLSLK